MSGNFYEKIKTRKPFEVGDILIYSCLILIVLVLFLCFVILPKNKDSNGFRVFLDDKEIFTFSYENESYSILDGYENYVVIDTYNNTVTIYHDNDKTEKNILSYSIEKHSVYMLDSNCSNSKDCTYEPAISNNGAIYCAPRKLTVLALNSNSSEPPIIGGGLWVTLNLKK